MDPTMAAAAPLSSHNMGGWHAGRRWGSFPDAIQDRQNLTIKNNEKKPRGPSLQKEQVITGGKAPIHDDPHIPSHSAATARRSLRPPRTSKQTQKNQSNINGGIELVPFEHKKRHPGAKNGCQQGQRRVRRLIYRLLWNLVRSCSGFPRNGQRSGVPSNPSRQV